MRRVIPRNLFPDNSSILPPDDQGEISLPLSSIIIIIIIIIIKGVLYRATTEYTNLVKIGVLLDSCTKNNRKKE